MNLTTLTISLLASTSLAKQPPEPAYCHSCPYGGARQCGEFFVEECKVYGVALCWEIVEDCKWIGKCVEKKGGAGCV